MHFGDATFSGVAMGFTLTPPLQFPACSSLGARLALLTPTTVGWIATGTLLYAVCSLVEAVGLMFRWTWAGWMAIGESAFFIPIEVHHLMRGFAPILFSVLVVNVAIVVYLYRNRRKLLHRRGRSPA